MKFTNAQAADAIREARGLMSVAARRLGVTRQALYLRLQKAPYLRETLSEAREFTADVAEAALFRAIENGEAWAVCFFLKCQAKSRGYIEKLEVRQDVHHSGAVDVSVTEARDELSRQLDAIAGRLSVVPTMPFGGGNGDGRNA